MDNIWFVSVSERKGNFSDTVYFDDQPTLEKVIEALEYNAKLAPEWKSSYLGILDELLELNENSFELHGRQVTRGKAINDYWYMYVNRRPVMKVKNG